LLLSENGSDDLFGFVENFDAGFYRAFVQDYAIKENALVGVAEPFIGFLHNDLTKGNRCQFSHNLLPLKLYVGD
jgi:hypothetical protein